MQLLNTTIHINLKWTTESSVEKRVSQLPLAYFYLFLPFKNNPPKNSNKTPSE